MRILIVYYLRGRNERNTIDEHLYSFSRFSGEECFHLNAFFGVPSFLARISFDLVIYHYSFTSLKWNGAEMFRADLEKMAVLKELSGYKIAIPQDEYVNTLVMCRFFRDFGIKTVFTCFPPKEYQKAYPRELSGLEHYITVLTGYIDEISLSEVSAYCRPQNERAIAIGYRARKLPFWLGKHGLVKWQLTECFLAAAKGKGIRVDLSNDYKDVFIGKDWYRFLSNCRVVLGCEGGASLLDPEGRIREKVEDYVMQHPDAQFEEVEKHCFEGLDGNIELFALSPRHFEACITKTCQALVEGEYAGIFLPGVHYIEIKKDWSNIGEVIEQIQDAGLCERIAQQAYDDIVSSGLYTYRGFVSGVLEHVRGVHPVSKAKASWLERIYLHLLQLRETAPFLFSPVRYTMHRSRFYSFALEKLFIFLRRHDLEREYLSMRRHNRGISVLFMLKMAKAALGLAASSRKGDGQ
jgi:hypothetical protein